MANKKNSIKISSVRNKTHNSVDKIMDKAEDVKERSKEAIANLKENTSKMKKNIDDYIQKNPKKSVLIAAGIGAIVSTILLTAMRRRRH